MRYSPLSVIACRAHQLLEDVLETEVMEGRGYPKPCLVLGLYKGEPGLYIIV